MPTLCFLFRWQSDKCRKSWLFGASTAISCRKRIAITECWFRCTISQAWRSDDISQMAHLSTSQYQKSQSIPYCKSVNTSKHTPELYSHQKDVNLFCFVVFYLFLDIVCLSSIRCIFCRCFSGFMCHIKMKLLLHQTLKRSVP